MPVHGEPMFPGEPVAREPQTLLDETAPAPSIPAEDSPAQAAEPAPLATGGVDPIEHARIQAQLEERGRIIDNILAHRPDAGQPSARAAATPQPPSATPPDAATDPDGFARWLAQRDAFTQHQIDQRIASQEARVQETLQLSSMWQEIVSDDRDFALANQEKFKDVFRKLGGHLPAGADPSEFKAYLVGRVRQLAGTPAAAAAPAQATPTAGQPAPTTAQPAANRTGGLSSISSPAPTRKKPEDNINPNRGLLDDLIEVQNASGYY